MVLLTPNVECSFQKEKSLYSLRDDKSWRKVVDNYILEKYHFKILVLLATKTLLQNYSLEVVLKKSLLRTLWPKSILCLERGFYCCCFFFFFLKKPLVHASLLFIKAREETTMVAEN